MQSSCGILLQASRDGAEEISGAIAKAGASLVAQTVKNLSAMGETHAQSLGREDLLEKGMAIPSSILAWRILWTENPGRLQAMDCKELDLTEQLTHFIYDVSFWWSWGAQSSDWCSAH